MHHIYFLCRREKVFERTSLNMAEPNFNKIQNFEIFDINYLKEKEMAQ